MTIHLSADTVPQYICNDDISPLFLVGNALEVLEQIPDGAIDCCMTSPPYWGQRQYDQEGIGLEEDYTKYSSNLIKILDQVRRVLKPSGSLWLNMGDSYNNKGLVGIPWRVAITLTDTKSWVLRNDIIWNKIKGGPDNTKDRLRNVHECCVR